MTASLRRALATIARLDVPYAAKQTSMRKLEEMGYVTCLGRHYGSHMAYKITEAGRKAVNVT